MLLWHRWRNGGLKRRICRDPIGTETGKHPSPANLACARSRPRGLVNAVSGIHQNLVEAKASTSAVVCSGGRRRRHGTERDSSVLGWGHGVHFTRSPDRKLHNVLTNLTSNVACLCTFSCNLLHRPCHPYCPVPLLMLAACTCKAWLTAKDGGLHHKHRIKKNSTPSSGR